MPATMNILELRADGDIRQVKIKQAGAKPSLKDFQTYLKKKVLPSLLTSYTYEGRKLTYFGYTTGKDAEESQHQLPPPYEAPTLYGSIVVLAHALKQAWDAGSPDQITVAEYEAFFEKACAGELEEEKDEDDDEEEEAEEDVEVAEEEEEAEEEDIVVGDEEGEEGGEEGEVDLDQADEEEEDKVRTVRASRKSAKVDPQDLQFQFASNLEPEPESTLETLNEYRRKMYTTLSDLFSEYCSEDELLNLERGIFNASLDEARRRMIPLNWQHETFRWIYATVSKRIAGNLKPDSYVGNRRLMERWKEGEFNLDMIGHWSPYELNPTHWKELKDQQFRREQRILEGNLAMATDRFKCSRCQKKMCTYYELQTRSADEPMTIFITCVNCGKQWRQ